jgi:hypothetical protein
MFQVMCKFKENICQWCREEKICVNLHALAVCGECLDGVLERWNKRGDIRGMEVIRDNGPVKWVPKSDEDVCVGRSPGI